ncbi:MAG TPA: alpha/beta hydrolase [Bacillota bacterium]|nr:alpha/beta hydrolase [Bacillota bacterium]
MERKHFTKEIITLMNTNIYCEYILNGKPPILLIHGFVASIHTFNRLMPLLAKHFSVVAIDLPGFGRSEKSKTFVYSYKNYATLLMRVIDYFGFQQVCIMGHSMGGQIALYTARMIPESIHKLILLNSSGYMGRAHRWLIFSSYLPFFHLAAKRYVQKQSVEDTLKNVLFDHSLITDELKEEYSIALRDQNFYRSLIRLLRHREGDLMPEQLQEIQQPVLLLWGKEDKVVPLDVGKQLAKDLPNASLTIYDNAGHLITEEKPEDIYEQIRAFI